MGKTPLSKGRVGTVWKASAHPRALVALADANGKGGNMRDFDIVLMPDGVGAALGANVFGRPDEFCIGWRNSGGGNDKDMDDDGRFDR